MSIVPATITVIDRSLVDQINEQHRLCERAQQNALEHARNCGRLLAEVKTQLRFGEFQAWIADNFTGSLRTAQVYMQVATEQPEAQSAAPVSSIAGALRQISKPKPVKVDRAVVDASLAEEFGHDDSEPAPTSAPSLSLVAPQPAVTPAPAQDDEQVARRLRKARDLWGEVGEHLSTLENVALSRFGMREEANTASVIAKRLIVALDNLAAAYE